MLPPRCRTGTRRAPCELGLAHAGRAEEQERADRAVGSPRPGRGCARRRPPRDSASSWPITRSCRCVEVEELLALGLHQPRDGDAGPPATISAISSRSTSSAACRPSPCSSSFARPPELRLELADRRRTGSRAASLRSPRAGPARARSAWRPRSFLRALTSSIAPSRLPPAVSAATWSPSAGELLLDAGGRAAPCEASSGLLLRSASRSISSCIMPPRSSSSSVGMLSISMRSLRAASSIRSIALSGRNRSAM
jgi:hypothetical protein